MDKISVDLPHNCRKLTDIINDNNGNIFYSEIETHVLLTISEHVEFIGVNPVYIYCI